MPHIAGGEPFAWRD